MGVIGTVAETVIVKPLKWVFSPAAKLGEKEIAQIGKEASDKAFKDGLKAGLSGKALAGFMEQEEKIALAAAKKTVEETGKVTWKSAAKTGVIGTTAVGVGIVSTKTYNHEAAKAGVESDTQNKFEEGFRAANPKASEAEIKAAVAADAQERAEAAGKNGIELVLYKIGKFFKNPEFFGGGSLMGAVGGGVIGSVIGFGPIGGIIGAVVGGLIGEPIKNAIISPAVPEKKTVTTPPAATPPAATTAPAAPPVTVTPPPPTPPVATPPVPPVPGR